MEFTEKDLERIIFETPSEKLEERGLYIHGKKLRQVKIGNYGTADLIAYRKVNTSRTRLDENGIQQKMNFRHLKIDVVKIIKGTIGVDDLIDAAKCCKGIRSFFIGRGVDIEVSASLIGNEIEVNQDFLFLTEYHIMPDVSVYLYSYDLLKGISFDSDLEYLIGLEEEGLERVSKLKKPLQEIYG